MSWLLLCTLIYTSVLAKEDPKYPVSAIPEDIKKDVNAVVREDVKIFTIHSDSRATLHALIVVTIFNSKASDFAEHSEWYSKLRKITKFEGKVYNENGEVIKKLKANEIIDNSAFDGSALHSDLRIKYADLSQAVYPYTIEFEYDIDYKFLYHIDGSEVISEEKVSVQKLTYQIIYPKSLEPRYKTYNINQKPIHESIGDNVESVRWVLQNLQPIKFEPLSNSDDVLPQIVTAPGKFEYDGYPGSMKTWEDYGKWQLSLNEGRDVISEATKNKIRELTKNIDTTEGKVKAIYEYLQNKTRYVNISLGIGGLQPFEALVVDEMGYGDCKGLSNYMVAMLKEIGVRGYYTKIMAGEYAPEIDVDFPSHQTNHIVVAVPNGPDTLWLECTSQTNPFDFQGTFTGDRKALMVTETGGKIVNTHRYTADQNVQSRTADVFVESTGDAKAKIKTTYSGLQYENGDLMFILNKQHDDQKEWVQDNTDIPAFDIVNFSMTNKKDKVPSAIVNINLVLKRFATVSGKRIFLTPNLMNRSTYIPEKLESRKTNIVLRTPYTDFDTIRYHLPEGIYPEFLPEPAKIKSRFGEYETTFTVDAGSLLYIRKIRMNKGEYPAESYKELTDFYKNINKADNMKMVFMSKT